MCMDSVLITTLSLTNCVKWTSSSFCFISPLYHSQIWPKWRKVREKKKQWSEKQCFGSRYGISTYSSSVFFSLFGTFIIRQIGISIINTFRHKPNSQRLYLSFCLWCYSRLPIRVEGQTHQMLPLMMFAKTKTKNERIILVMLFSSCCLLRTHKTEKYDPHWRTQCH